MPDKKKYLVCVLGPTAVGKTAAAVSLAQHFHTEIISADSRQFYREISIGTAKPSEEELAAVPHHFISNISVEQRYSAGDFARDALKKLDELFAAHDVVVLAGGSGLYVKALLEGLDQMPEADEALRAELHELFAARGTEGLAERLERSAAVKPADMKNPQRLMRAIEIAEGKQMAPAAEKELRNFIPIRIILELPREVLYDRINRRVDQMMQNGLLEEVQRMLPYKDTYALQTVGYAELFDFFEHRTTLEQAVSLIRQHTRNYAKRQITWFKREPDVYITEPEAINKMISHIETITKQ